MMNIKYPRFFAPHCLNAVTNPNPNTNSKTTPNLLLSLTLVPNPTHGSIHEVWCKTDESQNQSTLPFSSPPLETVLVANVFRQTILLTVRTLTTT